MAKPRETMDYLAACRRFIAAAGQRGRNGDEIELAAIIALHDAVDRAIEDAIDGMRARGKSWQYIAAATGRTRQAAFQRWGS